MIIYLKKISAGFSTFKNLLQLTKVTINYNGLKYQPQHNSIRHFQHLKHQHPTNLNWAEWKGSKSFFFVFAHSKGKHIYNDIYVSNFNKSK